MKTSKPEPWVELLSGKMVSRDIVLPIKISTLLGNLQNRFLPKCCAGRGYRSIARNGRVLLASRLALDQLTGRSARVRLQTWHRSLLGGDVPEPYGLLMVIDVQEDDKPAYECRLAPLISEGYDLGVEVGGGSRLVFYGRQPRTDSDHSKHESKAPKAGQMQ